MLIHPELAGEANEGEKENEFINILVSAGAVLVPVMIIILSNTVYVRISENSGYREKYLIELPLWFFLQVILFLYHIILDDKKRRGNVVPMITIICIFLFFINLIIMIYNLFPAREAPYFLHI